MSRSYRKPYSTFVGHPSSKWDKKFASRSYRRLCNKRLREVIDWEEFEPPVRYEAAHNDVWGWLRDGKQRLQRIGNRSFTDLGLGDPETYEHTVWWIKDCSRK